MHFFVIFPSVAYEEPVYEVPVVSDADTPARKQQHAHTVQVLTGSTDMTSQVYHILEETATTDEGSQLEPVVRGCYCNHSLLVGVAASIKRDVNNHMVMQRDSSANLYEDMD